jgi:hypothetical protein
MNSTRPALIIAHPGHELRVHHWIEKTRPLVLVLTDGSGRTTQSRLASTTRILEQAGAYLQSFSALAKRVLNGRRAPARVKQGVKKQMASLAERVLYWSHSQRNPWCW